MSVTEMLPGRANADAMKAFTGRPVLLKISSFRQLGSLLCFYCFSTYICSFMFFPMYCVSPCIRWPYICIHSAHWLNIVVTLVGAWLHFNPGARPSSAASCPLRLLPFSLMLQ